MNLTRVASQLTFCSPQQVLRRAVVERNEQNVITRLFCLDDSPVESAHTLFFDGILSAGIVSVKLHTAPELLAQVLSQYHYLDLTTQMPSSTVFPMDKPLILDFGITSCAEINGLFRTVLPFLSAFSVFDIIAASTYYPAQFLGLSTGIVENSPAQILLWEQVDLVNKRVTHLTRIRDL